MIYNFHYSHLCAICGHHFLYSLLRPLVHLCPRQIKVSADGSCVDVLTARTRNTFIVLHASAYALERVVPIHCVKEGEDERLLISEFVGTCWASMPEPPIWRIAIELCLYKVINTTSDVKVYIQCYGKLTGQITTELNLKIKLNR